MNDLRSRSRSLTAVADEEVSPRSTPPRVRPDVAAGENRSSAQRMSRRQSIEERARRENDGKPDSGDDSGKQPAAQQNGQRLSKKQRRAARAAQRAKERQGSGQVQAGQAQAGNADHVGDTDNANNTSSNPGAARQGKGADTDTASGLPNRPNRRRETEEESTDEEKFPWHFQFDDDEPDQLQASSPLLSRAFRATIG